MTLINESDIERFTNDPTQLVELCRLVTEQLTSKLEGADARGREAQLKEISKAIERLERCGIDVPEGLRSEKTRLAADLGHQTEAKQTLAELAQGLNDVLFGLYDLLGRRTIRKASVNISDTGRPKSGRISHESKTSDKVLRECIIKALRKMGGRGKAKAVIMEVGKMLEGKLTPFDLQQRGNRDELVWQNNARWERNQMKDVGILRSDSPKGYWELTEDYK